MQVLIFNLVVIKPRGRHYVSLACVLRIFIWMAYNEITFEYVLMLYYL